MKKYILVTDSVTDLPDSLAKELDLVVLPLKYHIDNKDYINYLDYRMQDINEFYNEIKGGKQATTSQLVPEDYISTLTPYLEQGNDVLIISFSSKLSGTFNSARLASIELQDKYPNNKIIVIDSKSASLGEGFLVTLAANEKKKGKTIDELVSFVNETIPRVAHWFTVDDIGHLRRGGRISGVASVVAKALNIKPILHCSIDGELVSRTKAISRNRAIKALFDKMVETHDGNQEMVYIGHGADLEAANELKNLVLSKFPEAKVTINTIGPVVGAHTGQGVLALFFIAKNR